MRRQCSSLLAFRLQHRRHTLFSTAIPSPLLSHQPLQSLLLRNRSDPGTHCLGPSPVPPELHSANYRKFDDSYDQYTEIHEHPRQTPINELGSEERSASMTYGDVVRRFVGSLEPCDAEGLHPWLIKSGFEEDRFLTNSLINQYAKMGELDVARKVFDRMPNKNVVSWTCLVSGYAQFGFSNYACSTFRSMISLGVAPTQYTFGSVLQACQGSGMDLLVLGAQTHALIWKMGYGIDCVVCNALIAMYGTCSTDPMGDVRRVFDDTPKANLVSWNSAISVFSRKGDAISVLELFSSMRKTDFGYDLKPNEYSFASLITATYSSLSSIQDPYCLQFLTQILTQVVKTGFLSDLYVGSALVSAFARFGLIDKAVDIFLEMPNRNVVSMNGLMVGLVKQKHGEEAMKVFKETSGSVVINDDCYLILLAACNEFYLPEEGRWKGKEVHGVIIRTGLNNINAAVGNGLINMYAKCDAIDDAYKVFKLMHLKDRVSWNSIITGLDQSGCCEEALLNFHRMHRSGILPSNFAVISSLSSCANLRFQGVGVQVHSGAVKLGLDLDISVSNSLLTLYGGCGCIAECWKVFHCMPSHDLVSWNCMIGTLANLGASISEVLDVLLDMMRKGWNPNRVTFVNIYSTLSAVSALGLGNQVHALVIKHGYSGDNSVENALLSCYGKCGDMNACECLFYNMFNRRDDVSWNSMVSGYVHNEFFAKAMDFIWLMKHNGHEIDCFTISTVLSACASLAALERGMEMHAFGIRSLAELDIVVDSSLVDMYSKCGRVDYAFKVFRSMPSKNEFSWNSMITGYARHGHAAKALELFENMCSDGHRPDHITYIGILSACSHAGLVEEGLAHFESMSKKYRLIPRMEHYSCVVDLLGRAGKLEEVEDFLRKMPVSPNVIVWRTVLGACCRVKSDSGIDLGKRAGKMLLELEPQNPVNFVLISQMYANRGKWDDEAEIRAAMRGATMKKEAGCSWVTMRDGLHVFVAGDRSHPDTEKIYAQLHVLNQRIRNAGYIPKTDFSLYDLDTENKEELLSYHSERLAVAFVLTRSSALPIRIMKNLRVCGDCHSAFGFISKVVGRQIILRDSNRFHHFVDGKCSCGDYW